MLKSIRGMKDMWGEELERFRSVEKTARHWLALSGYMEIATPILELTELFRRSIGEATDIVEKEMYTFTDVGGDSLTLRPEATAGVLRALAEHHILGEDQVVKLFTLGPMFRHERPQKGRLRQFHQINAEVLGSAHPWVDGETLFLAWTILKEIGLEGTLAINSLGCPDCRPAFRDKLFAFLDQGKGDLCADCQRRAITNPLRLFDCKSQTCQAVLAGAPVLSEYLCPDCREHFVEVKATLARLAVPFEENPRLVRGLDYYVRTTFEIQISHLGAQNAVAGGGRYDGLVKVIGGPDIPGIGFALGVDRILVALSDRVASVEKKTRVFITAMGDSPRLRAYTILMDLRKAGVSADMVFEPRSLKSQMRRANRWGARLVLILGEEEEKKGEILVRDMETSQQESVLLDRLLEEVKKRIGKEESL